MRTSYLPSEILWGHDLAPLLTYQKDNGRYKVDFSQFHNVVAVDTPELSAKEMPPATADEFDVSDEVDADDTCSTKPAVMTDAQCDNWLYDFVELFLRQLQTVDFTGFGQVPYIALLLFVVGKLCQGGYFLTFVISWSWN